MEGFMGELSVLLNKYSKENTSNTPDFILAEYMISCLEAFNVASNRRGRWYGEEKIQNERDWKIWTTIKTQR